MLLTCSIFSCLRSFLHGQYNECYVKAFWGQVGFLNHFFWYALFYGPGGAVARTVEETVFSLCLLGFSPCSSFPHSSKTCSELEMLQICPRSVYAVSPKPCDGVGEDPVTYPGKIIAKKTDEQSLCLWQVMAHRITKSWMQLKWPMNEWFYGPMLQMLYSNLYR